MALSARELFLIVRAQNQASGTLRRVGADMAALGKHEQLQMRRNALQLQQQSLLNKGHALRNDLVRQERAVSGEARKRAQLDLDRKALALTDQQARARGRIRALTESETRAMRSSTAERIRWRNAMRTATADEYRATRALAANGAEIQRSSKRWNSVRDAVRSAVRQFPIARTEQVKLAESFTKMGNDVAKTKGNLLANSQALTQWGQKMRQLKLEEIAHRWERIGRAGHLISGFGRQLQLVGGAGAAALGFAANSAAQLETQATLAATQLGNTGKQVAMQAKLNIKAITDQMQQFPAASADMAKSLYDIFSTLDVKGKQGRDILVQVNKAAVAGSLSVQDATGGALTVLSNFKDIAQTGPGIQKAFQLMFAAVRFGRMSMAEFSKTLTTTAPAAKIAQQTFQDLSGTMAFLSRSLGPTKAAVGYQRLLEVLGGPQMSKGLAKFGVSLRDNQGNFLQLSQMIDVLVKRFPQLEQGGFFAANFFKQIGNLQSTSQARRAFSTLVTNIAGYRSVLKKTIDDHGEFTKSFNAMSQTSGVKWAVALNRLKSLWVQVGAAAIPAIAGMMEPISQLVGWFQKLDDETKTQIGRWIAYGAAALLVVGTLMTVVGTLTSLLSLIKLSSLGLLGASTYAIAFAGAAYLIYTNWDTVRGILSAVSDALKPLLSGLADLAGSDVGRVAIQLLAVASATSLIVKAFTAFTALRTVTTMSTFGQAAADAFRVAIAGSVTWGSALKTLLPAIGPAGWVVLGVTAAVGVYMLLNSILGDTKSRFDRINDAINKVSAASKRGQQALGAFRSAGVSLAQLNVAIDNQRQSLNAATRGTLAWKEAEATLNQLQQQRIVTLRDLKKAQDDLTNAQDATSSGLRTLVSEGAFASGGFSLAGQADTILSYRDAVAKLQQLQGGPVTQTSKIMIEGLQQQLGAFEGARDSVRRAARDYQDYVASGVDPASKSMRELRKRIMDATGALSAQDPKSAQELWHRMGNEVTQFTKELGRVPSPKLIQYIESIPPAIRKGMHAYSQLTGQILSHDAAKLLWDNPKQQQALATFMAKTKAAFGSPAFNKAINQIKIVPQFAQGDLANFIKQKGHMPKDLKAWITLEVKGHDEAVRKARKTARDIARASIIPTHIRTEQALGGALPTKGTTQALSAAARQIDALNRKRVNIRAKVAWSSKDPFKPFVTSAGTAATRAGKQLNSTVGFASKAGVLAGVGWQQGFNAHAVGKATATITINAYTKTFGQRSPSRVMMEKGKGAAEGWVIGFTKQMVSPGAQAQILKAAGINVADLMAKGTSAADRKKQIQDAIASAFDTAVQTMQSKWQELKDQNVTNFGALFDTQNIRDRLDWGQALNVGDLQSSLKSQLDRFRKFNQDLALLRKRGVSGALIDQLRQLGPDAQNQLSALTGASKEDLKKYNKLFLQSQKALNRATNAQFKNMMKDWRAHGRAMAIGLLLGLKQEGPQLEAYFRKLFKNLIASAKAHNKSHSPSRLYMEEGINIVRGLRLGMERESRGLSVPRPGMMWGHGRPAMAGGHVEYHDHVTYHVSPLANPDYIAALKKLDFQRRKRKIK